MIKCLWAVIDPKLDRPFFSYDPPPVTLERTPGMRVIRYEYELPNPVASVEVRGVYTEEEARQHARTVFAGIKESPSS